MYDYQQPDPTGHFGIYGGSFVSETLTHAINELKAAYASYQHDPEFIAEFNTSSSTLLDGPLRSTMRPAPAVSRAARRFTSNVKT